MDVIDELENVGKLERDLTSSIEKLHFLYTDIDLKQYMLKDSLNPNVVNIIKHSQTGLESVSLEDIASDPYTSLVVSIENDRSLIGRIWDSIKKFFVAIYKKVKSIIKWFGKKLGLIDKELSVLSEEINGKQGKLRIENLKEVSAEDMEILYKVLSVHYWMFNSIDYKGLINTIVDMKALPNMLSNFEKLVLEKQTKDKRAMDTLLRGEIGSLKTYVKTNFKIPTMLVKLNAISPNKELYPEGKNGPAGLEYTKVVPLTIGGDTVTALVSYKRKNDDNGIVLWKGKVTEDKFSTPAVIPSYSGVTHMLKAVSTLDKSGFIDGVDTLLEVSKKAIDTHVATIEELSNKEGVSDSKEIKVLLSKFKDINLVITKMPIEMSVGYKSTIDAIKTYIKVMDRYYI